MLVIGTSRALLPDPLGVGNDRRVAIRQPSIVQVVSMRRIGFAARWR